MKIRSAALASTFALSLLGVGLAMVPLQKAQAHGVSISVHTPEFGIRVGESRPTRPVIVQPAPTVVYAPPPAVVHAPPRSVYAPSPAVVYAPPPRVVYAPPRVVYAPGYHPRWHKHHRHDKHDRYWDDHKRGDDRHDRDWDHARYDHDGRKYR